MLAATRESFIQKAFRISWILEHFFGIFFKGIFANMVEENALIFYCSKEAHQDDSFELSKTNIRQFFWPTLLILGESKFTNMTSEGPS